MPHPAKTPPLRIYLITPRTPLSFWSMQGTVDAVGVRSLMPSGALATLIGLTPPELRGAVEYRYCDENLEQVQWDLPCDLVAISGFTLHAERIAAIAGAFRARGVPVALGGAFATLDTELARPLCDHLFVGEGELTWPRFLRDLSRGEAQPLYEQTEHVEMALSPPPDWRFVDGKDYLYMTVQSARGCPNKCDFCDAIQLIGRRHRRKPIDQVLVEVDAAHRAGCEVIFFSDDNFMVHRGYTRALLQRLIDWNTALPHPVQFSCQTSVTITDDEEILRLMADARFAAVFLGVESLRRECLEEINKGHLYRADMADRVHAMARYGLLPFLGLIVGFDADDDDSFDEIRALPRADRQPHRLAQRAQRPRGHPAAHAPDAGRPHRRPLRRGLALLHQHHAAARDPRGAAGPPPRAVLPALRARKLRAPRHALAPERGALPHDLHPQAQGLDQRAQDLPGPATLQPPRPPARAPDLLQPPAPDLYPRQAPDPQGHHRHDPVLPLLRLRFRRRVQGVGFK